MENSKSTPGSGGAAYAPAQLAELLSRCGLGSITEAMIVADLAAGAPRDPAAESGGPRLNPFHYMAWLLKRGDDAA